MAGPDGTRLVALLREDPRLIDMPIIILSARADEEARIEGMSTGADDYVVKPVSSRELVARASTTRPAMQNWRMPRCRSSTGSIGRTSARS